MPSCPDLYFFILYFFLFSFHFFSVLFFPLFVWKTESNSAVKQYPLVPGYKLTDPGCI